MIIRSVSVAKIVNIALVSISTLLLGCVGYINYQSIKKSEWTKLRDNLTVTTSQLSTGLAISVWNIDDSQIAKIIESTMKNQSIYGIALHSEGDLYLRFRDNQWDIAKTDKVPPVDGMLTAVQSINFRDRQIGTVSVYISPKFIQAELKRILITTIVVILLLDLSLVVILYLFLNYIVLNPLKAVERFAGDISSGKNGEIHIKSAKFYGELESLCNSIKGMFDLLDRRYADLLDSEQRARQSEEKYRDLVEHANSNIIRWYPDGTINFFNEFAEKTFGFSREEVLGENLMGTIVPKSETSGRDLGAMIQKIVQNPENYLNNENENICKNGERLWISWANKAILDSDGQLIELLSVGQNITERRQLEQQLLQQQKLESLGRLAGGIAHDFNNMLAGIMASAELLKRRLSDDERNLKPVATILEASHRSAELTRELLAFSRKGQITFTPVSVHEIVSTVMALLERTIDKSICVETNLTAENFIVRGDAALLQNALLNLAINACDAMPEGGTLSLSTANMHLDESTDVTWPFDIAAGHFVELAISDTGTGMTKDVLDHIFEPFYTTKDQGKGTGLGLAAVYGTIKDHHGAINIFSEPGVGSIFKAYLPVSSDSLPTPLTETNVSGSGGILLVDDEAILRSAGKALLEDLGYTVYLAEDGIQALEVYAQERGRIQLVLLDMIMPGPGGKDTFLKLKEVYPDVQVLFCSGFHREGSNEEFVRLGAKGFIQKPYSRETLGKAVADTIAK
jgi:PAS domain S-box-containing protein